MKEPNQGITKTVCAHAGVFSQSIYRSIDIDIDIDMYDRAYVTKLCSM